MKKVLAVLVSLLLLCGMVPLSAISVAAADSGITGNCTWTLDDNGHLTISGNGAMANYDAWDDDPAPWGTAITSVTIEDGVTNIGSFAFYDCDSLTSVTIGNSVTTIGYSAFAESNALESVIIPDSVITIVQEAFAVCTGLISVVIGDGVTVIGDHAFDDCESLASIIIPDSVTTIGDYAFDDCESLASIIIPDSVTTISRYAFGDCESLASIIIPDSVTTIEDNAFYGCESLTAVTIPYSVTEIHGRAFYACTSMTAIDVDENNPNYSSVDGVLFNKEQTILVQYPDAKQGAYIIPDSVTAISDYAFCHCKSLTSLAIPDNVTTIEPSAVFNCYNMTLVNIGDGVTTIGCYAFGSSYALTTIRLPLSLTEVDDWAFEDCPELTDVYYPGSEDDRANISFGDDNDYLLNATWHYNFTGCLHVYSGVADLDCDLCGEVREIPTIKASVNTIVDIICGGEMVDFLFVPTESGLYSFGSYGDEDTYGYIFDANGNELSCNDDGGGEGQFYMEYDMEAGETYVLRACYYNDDNTGSFPVRVQHLRDGYQYALNDRGEATIIGYRGEMPTTLAIPATIDGYTVTAIGDSAFADRYSLTSVIIPDSVTTIGDVAFYECNNLETVRLPGNLTEVGYEAFEYCYDLTDVYYVGSPEDSSHITFGEYNDYLLDATWHYNFTGCFHSYSSLTDPDCDLCGEVRELRIIEAGVDTTVTITYGGEMVDFIFVPAETGLYSFGAYGDEDTYGYILDAHGNELDRNDDGGEDNQFLMKYEMAAGEVYILRARYYSEERTGSFPVRVDHKAIESITIDPMEIIEGSQDLDYYLVYNCSITVTYTDGSTEQGNAWHFDASTNELALQQGQPWTAGNTYTVTATLLGVEVPFEVSILPNPVVSVELENSLIYVEHTNGEWDDGGWNDSDEWVEQDWYEYSLNTKSLILTVTTLDGNVFSGSWGDLSTQMEAYLGNQAHSWGWNSDQSVDHPWSIDGAAADQIFRVKWLYHWIEVPVTIIENPIVSIEVEDVVHIVGTGEWYEDWNEMDEYIEWMYYDPTPETITVTLNDGTTASGSLEDIYEELGYRLEYATDQSFDNPWGVGDHTATIYYGSFEAEYTVSVTESPIASIEIQPLTYMEGTNGYWEDYWDENDNYVEKAWYRYDVYPWYLTCTVTLTDGTVYSGDWYDVREQLYGLFGDAVYNYDYTSDQSYDNQWGVGDHVATLTWLGQMVEYTVTIVVSPIAYIEAEPLTYIEGTNGEWDGHWNEDDEWVENSWYCYDVYIGNITVHLKDGTSVSGSSHEIEEELGISLHWYGDQSYENQWGLGDHTAFVSVGDQEWEYTISIIESPIAYIEVEPMTFVEGHGGDWQDYWNEEEEEWDYWYYYEVSPEYVTVHMKDGTSVTGHMWEMYHELGIWLEYSSDQSYDNQWGVGEHTVTIFFDKYEWEYTVTIVEPPIASIELEDISIIENTRGYEEDGRFFYSSVYAQGTVTYVDGTTETFSYDIEIDDYWYSVETNASALQYEESWTVGNTYIVTGTVMGVSDTFAVTIVPSPVESFVVKDLVLYECFDSESESEGWDRYYATAYLEQVLFTDGTLGEIDRYGELYYEGESYYVDSNCWDMQYEEHWQPGNTYTATATLMGVTSTFNITILPNPVKEIVLTKMPDKTTYLVGEALDLKGAVLSVVYNDGTYEDIAFDTHFAGGYSFNLHLEKIDRDVWFYQNIWFAEAGRQNAVVELADYTCNVPVLVQENLMESLSVREDADKNVILTAHNSDGTTTDMKVLDIPYIWPWDENVYYGSLLTDKGCYLARIFVGEDTFAVGLYITQEDEELGTGTERYIESEPVVGGDWFRVMEKMLSSNWYYFPNDYSLAYNREVTAENIDAVVALAIYRCSFDWWDDVEWVDDGSLFGWMVFDAALVRQALAEVFGLNNVDLTLSQHYDAAANTFMMYNWINSGGEVSFDLPSNVYYADGLWHVTVHSVGETVNVWFDDNFRIVAAGIHADIPTVEPVVPAAKPGDANGDGRINNRDLGLLQQYLADWGVALDPDVMDLNNDGRVNNRDLGLLQQYLADWDVELK